MSKCLCLLLLGGAVNATSVHAAGTTYTTVASATGNWSDTTKWAGGVVASGVGNKGLLGAGGSTFTLDVPITLGIIQDGQGSARAWTINNSGLAMTFDNTGGINNPLGNADAWLGSTSSGPVNFQPSIIMANTDLHMQLIGSTSPVFTQGILSTTTITATAPRTLFFHSDSGGAAGMTINSSIGGSGSSITISNVGVGTRTVTLAGVVGPNASVVQNATSSVLKLNAVNTYTGSTTITLGTLQLGNNNVIPSVSSVDITGTLNTAGFNDTIDALTGAGTVNNGLAGTPTLTVGGNNSGGTFSGIIQNTLGTLSFAKTGSGTEILTGANTYSGTTTFNGGILNAGSADSPGSSGPFGSATAAGSMVFSGGTLQYSDVNQADYSSRFSTAANQFIKIDTATQAVTFATALISSGGSLTKVGNGTLTLTAAETYTGNTTVNGGTLALSGSAALASASTINIGAGGTFDVSALASPYTIGGSASMKASGTGTTVGTTAANLIGASGGIFDLGSQPVSLTWGGGSAGVDNTHPALLVSQGTLNLNNNAITVIVPGTALSPGVYTLISAPAITGTPNVIPSFTGGNGLASGNGGVISVSGTKVILTVTASGGVVGTWNVDANGNWSDGSKWSSNPNVPNAAGDAATLGVGSVLRTVTLNANETVGSLTLTNSNSFVIASGGNTLTLDNAGSGVAVNVTAGTANAIQTAVALKDNTVVTIGSGKSLTLAGSISNTSAAKTLTFSSAGTAILSVANTYGPTAGSVGTTFGGGGTLQVGNSAALAAGDVSVSGSSILKSGAAGLSVGNNLALADTTTVDNNGNNLTLGGVISGAGGLSKTGNGTLTLNGVNTYTGDTTVNTGTASAANDANFGAVGANKIILNGGTLLGNGTFALDAGRNVGIGPATGSVGTNALIDAASGQALTINGVIASAGNGGVNNLTVNSGAGHNGTLILAAANTFNGSTIISNGVLQLANSGALQNSGLNYNSGKLQFDASISAATLGGFNCTDSSKILALTNLSGSPVTLTVGGNNAAVIFGNNLTEAGSLVKTGTGTLTVSNANYTGGTTINGGSGAATILAGTFGSSSSPITVGANFTLTNATATASTFNLATAGAQTGVGATISGAANLTNTATTIGSSGNTAGGLALNTTGGVSLGDVKVNKTAGNAVVGTAGVGLVVNGGNVIASSVNIAQSGTGSRGADMNMNGGTLTIADASQTGKFALHAGTGTAFLTMTGGTLNYLGIDGLQMSIGTGNSYASISGGTANLTGITLNSGSTATTNILTVNGTNNPTLYLGNVGLVINLPTDTVAATFGSGTIGALADWGSDAPITLTNNPIFKAADAANVAHSITLSNVLSGAGGFTKTGNGMLSLLGANTYTGNTIVNAGTLLVQQLSFYTNSTVYVNNGATLNLGFAGANIVRGLVLNGVSKADGVYSQATDPAFLAGTGSLQVIGVSSVPTNITTSVSGNALTLSWPADHLGWHLQIQTNSLAMGLNTNWVTLAGSDTVTTTNFVMNPANGSVFYRLVYP